MQVELYRISPVFTKIRRNNQDIWLRVGKAVHNNDGTMRVVLDVVPMNGKLLISELDPTEVPHAS